MKLSGKVGIVTGSASGIGRGIALEFAKEGANVVVADLNREGAGKVVEEIKALGREGLAVKVDVSRSQEVNEMVSAALKRFGQIDILVNNAGGTARERASMFYESTEEIWDYVLGINLKGVMNCSRATINHMMERKSGTMINIAAIAGTVGTAGRADYSAAKGGIIAFTKALAKEVASYGVRVVAISPGTIETPMRQHLRKDYLEQVKKHVPMVGRVGTPEDIGHMAAFLASEEGSFITGQNIIVDGGSIIQIGL